MRIKIIFLLLILLSGLRCYPQRLDERNATLVINKYIESFKNDDEVILKSEVFTSIFINENRQLVFESLKDFFSESEIRSAENIANNNPNNFIWTQGCINGATVLQSDSVDHLLKSNTIKVVILKKRNFFLGKRRIVKKPNKNIVYLKTSQPIFINDYCLINILKLKGNTTGSHCLYLYKYDNEHDSWIVVKSVSCMLI